MSSTPRAVIVPSTILTDRYTRAVAYAAAIHGTTVRKGTDITYLCHLLGVSALVLEAGGDETQAIAGLLHDSVEDAGGLARLSDVRARFGDGVADIVLACSDSTDPAWKADHSYEERKNRYLRHLEFEASDAAVLVSIADKVHNARAIVTDLARSGYDVLAKFTGAPEHILHYYRELVRIADARGVTTTLTIPLGLAVDVIASAIERNGK